MTIYKLQHANYIPFAGSNVLGDFSAENSVVHEKNLHIGLAGNKEFLESVREDVSGLMVLFVANEHLLWLSTSESSSGGAIDTSNGSVTVWLYSSRKELVKQ